MAEDYLTDDEQWEAIKRWIAENGAWMLGGVVLGAALLFGWRYFQSHQNDVALRAAARFDEMTALLERDDRKGSRQVAAGIIKEFPKSPYADQAQLTIARLAVDDGQLASAIAPLTQVMNESQDTELRHIARLRLARVLTAEGKPDEAIKTLAGDAPGAFAGGYHEVRGDALYAKQDFKGAAAEYQAALDGSGPGGVDGPLLQLKIADLGLPRAPTPAPATAMVPAPSPSNKAKP